MPRTSDIRPLICGLLLAISGFAAEMARAHARALGEICGAGAHLHCSWCVVSLVAAALIPLAWLGWKRAPARGGISGPAQAKP